MEEDNKVQDSPEVNVSPEPVENVPKEEVSRDSVEEAPKEVFDSPKIDEVKPVSQNTNSEPFNWKMVAIVLGVIVLLFLAYSAYNSTSSPTGNVVKEPNSAAKASVTDAKTAVALVDGKVKLDFYVMSQCPYGTQVEDAIAPVLEKLGGNVDFNLNFISTDLGDGTFKSLHGDPETNGNIVQLCAAKYNPDKYMDMIVCQNKDAKSIPGNWEECAVGLDVDKIKACYEGDEGKTLLSENVKLAAAVSATGSPTIYLNDKPYSGGRSEGNFLTALCNAFETKPEACSNLPEPVKFETVIINDKRCKECDTTNLVAQLTSLFPGMTVKTVDYMDEDGMAEFKDLNIDLLPALLFDKGVEKDDNYANVENFIEEKGDYLNLKIGAAWDPNKEICDNSKDDNDDGKVDCDDPTCDGNIACLEKKEIPEVELFIMSHCPYGTQTEKGMLPVMELLGDKADIEIKFVNYAMHGEKEVNEQTLQYCIQEEQTDKFLPYLKCFLDAGKTEDCLGDVDVDMLDACIEATDAEFEITKLLEDKESWQGGSFPQFNIHAAENEKYGIRGSPGLALNGVSVDSFGRDPASLLAIVCNGFEDKPSECDETLSSASPSPGFGFGEAAATAAPAAGGCGV